MTEYFEVHGRDGAARLGELRLDDPVSTPALVDSVEQSSTGGRTQSGNEVIEDAGSLWARERELPEGADDRLTILPHRAFPPGTRDPVRESFRVEHPEIDAPTAAVISSEEARDVGADAYLLSDANGFVGHASAFKDAIVRTHEAIPADTALYLSGVATPRNVATLVYAGVDLVDAKKAKIRGAEGFYLTSEGERFLEDLRELPCSCSACQQPIEAFDRRDCAEHNANALRTELRVVRERIREGRLRDYVEGQARHDQWLTAAFREFDQQYQYVEERAPVVRDSELAAASGDSIRRPEIQRFAERVTNRYETEFDGPLVLVPCSAKKPYSESQSHRQFHDAIQWRGHLASMTSPIGVVPQELELTYPAQQYDTVVTGRWTADEQEFVAEVLRRYLERNDYDRVVAHVPPGGYTQICETVEPAVDAEFEYTVVDHPTTDESLAALSEALSGVEAYQKRTREHRIVRAMADYQIGEGAGEALFPSDEIQTTSRYPKLQVRDTDGEQLATMVPQYGVLSFTTAGARKWAESDAPSKTVEIDGFVPKGSVLAPGIVDADEEIRTGDDVIVSGPKAFGVGRAAMFGEEMQDSTRGIAVEMRHVDET
ncbi:archaeosine synthase subunit alpha [Halolamina salifodinae]|uniref:Archaeosine synthase n=1 Tax=Halolamina salifodinae TaxID=1202767 RepID=A0A8T4GSJ1_9EURY|nr:archaeosine synthase subunit alpha [Halolamina salifodinae]MBP1986071.1 archaeosine synthase [Halolamina salifodinae]